MNKEIANPFNSNSRAKSFEEIKISLASPEKIVSWSFGEIRKPETLIIEHSNLKGMVCFVQEYLVLLKIMNVFVVNIKG